MTSSYLQLREISIQVSKAYVPCDATSALYLIRIINKVSRAEFNVYKNDKDYDDLVVNLLAALQPGHICSATCPWFHTDIQQKLPKKSIFFAATNKRIVSTHLKLYHELLRTICNFCLHQTSRVCTRATEETPRVLFNFLFGQNSTYMCEAPMESPVFSIRKSSCTRMSTLKPTCSVCSQYLNHSLTTLPCGHIFHDDCILEALNQRLICPSCLAIYL